MQTNNRTAYGIHDVTDRTFLISYNIFIALSSLLGDPIILIACLKYQAIKLHKTVVIIIQHLAVCDLLLTVFRIIPQTAALIADNWVTGTFLGHVQNNVNYVSGSVTMTLTCALTVVKLLVVKYPFRTAAWSARVGHVLCAALWLFQLISWIPWFVVNMFYVRDTLFFSYRTYQCSYNYFSPETPAWFTLYASVNFLVATVLLMILIFVTSLLLLLVAWRSAARHREAVRWQGIRTVLLTVGVFYVSLLPWNVVYATFLMKLVQNLTAIRATFFLTNFNINANFLIYALTVKSFRKFLKNRFKIMFNKRSNPFLKKVQTQRGGRSEGPAPLQRQSPSTGVEPAFIPITKLQQTRHSGQNRTRRQAQRRPTVEEHLSEEA